MKYLIFLSFCLFSVSVSAQNFVTTGKTWFLTQCFADSSGGGNGPQCTDYEYSFGESVEIDGQEYLSLMTTNESELYSHSYYREEAGKVYARGEETEEFLIYDFTLEVGDTVTAGNPNEPGYNSALFTVKEVEFIPLEDGSLAKQLKVENPLQASFRWIEGVGSSDNTFAPGTEWENDYTWHWFKCVFEEDELFYTVSSSCNLVRTEEIAKVPLEIYPNPSSSIFNVSLPSDMFFEEKWINIYSVTGDLVLTKNFDNEMIGIDVSALGVGVYLVKVTAENKSYYGKIIKQ